MKDYKQLRIWQETHELAKDIGYIKEKEFAVLEDKTDKVCRMLIITAMNSSGVRRPASRGD